MEQRQRLLLWAQSQQGGGGGAAADTLMAGGGGGGGVPSTHGAGRPIPDYIRLPGEEGAEEGDQPPEEEEEEEVYAGQWHKPPQFQDGLDGDKK